MAKTEPPRIVKAWALAVGILIGVAVGLFLTGARGADTVALVASAVFIVGVVVLPFLTAIMANVRAEREQERRGRERRGER